MLTVGVLHLLEPGESGLELGWNWAGIGKKTGLLISLVFILVLVFLLSLVLVLAPANSPVTHGGFFLSMAYNILQSPIIFPIVMRWRVYIESVCIYMC